MQAQVIDRENARRILSDLVAIRSVNPMGRDRAEAGAVESEVNSYLADVFAAYPVANVKRQACGDLHENLIVAVAGRNPDAPALLLESHGDTVPADDWPERAFRPAWDGDRLYARGACDDKGPLTAMVLAVADLLSSGCVPERPLLLVAAADEEYAQTGIRRFCEGAPALRAAVFGEPTSLNPIVQHKGTLRWDLTVRGRSAHSSKPELGRNAILGAMDTIRLLQQHECALQQRHRSSLMTGPTLTVTMIEGGTTRNAVPSNCRLALDFRLIPGMDLAAARTEVLDLLDGGDWEIAHSELQLQTPPLATDPADPFCRLVLDACREYARDKVEFRGAPYGTDASWVTDLAPAVVLGPGDIVCAHAVDEYVDLDEVVDCARIYRRIIGAVG